MFSGPAAFPISPNTSKPQDSQGVIGIGERLDGHLNCIKAVQMMTGLVFHGSHNSGLSL